MCVCSTSTTASAILLGVSAAARGAAPIGVAEPSDSLSSYCA